MAHPLGKLYPHVDEQSYHTIVSRKCHHFSGSDSLNNNATYKNIRTQYYTESDFSVPLEGGAPQFSNVSYAPEDIRHFLA